MMILRSSPASPFVRKVRIAIAVLGFDAETQIETADTNEPADPLRRQNPLGKIPVLIAEDDTAYFDSRVILEFLDERAGGGRIVPREAKARLAALRLKRCATAFSMLRSSQYTRRDGVPLSIASKNGSIIRPAK